MVASGETLLLEMESQKENGGRDYRLMLYSLAAGASALAMNGTAQAAGIYQAYEISIPQFSTQPLNLNVTVDSQNDINLGS